MVERGALTRYGPLEWPCQEDMFPISRLHSRLTQGAKLSPGALDTHLLVEGVQEYNSLHGLPQPHFISKDCVSALGPGEPQPVQPFQLVGM